MTDNEQIINSYLDLLDQQREEMYKAIINLDESRIWRRLAANGWCIGEILDHTRSVNNSFLPLLRAAWFFGQAIAKLNQNKSYNSTIDNVYQRSNFPLAFDRIWPPKYSPKKPIPLESLYKNLHEIHSKYRKFYLGKNPRLLGHVYIFDPILGRLNLIQALRVGIYHDQLHFDDVLELSAELKLHTTPVA